MSEREHPIYDDILKNKFETHISPVSEGIFDRIISERADTHPAFDNVFKEKLADYPSEIPDGSFEGIMSKRKSRRSPFFEFFKRKLGQHETESVPTDMFERIMNARETARPAAWWQNRKWQLTALGLLLLLMAAVSYEWSKEKSTNNNGVELSINPANSVETSKNVASTEGGKNVENEKANSTLIEKNTANNESYNFNKNQENSANKSAILNKKQDDLALNSFNKKANTRSNKAENKQNTLVFNKNQDNSNQNKDESTNTNRVNEFIPEKSFLTKKAEQEAQSDALVLSPEKQQFNNPVNFLSPLRLATTEGVTINTKNPCADPGDGCPTFGRKVRLGSFGEKKWYVDVYGAPEIAFRQLKLNTPDAEAQLRARDTTEKVLYGMSAGTRASLVFENGLSFRAGVVYSVNNERYQKDSLARQEILRIDRQTGELLGIDVIETLYRRTVNNKFRSVDFTLQAGYEVPINDVLGFSVHAGANLNYLSEKKVRFQTAIGTLDSVIQNFGQSSPAVFQNTWGVSLMGSVAGYVRATERLQFFVEPQLRYYMRPLSRNDYPLTQRYSTLGVHVGLRFKL
jgi:hypothetical protein